MNFLVGGQEAKSIHLDVFLVSKDIFATTIGDDESIPLLLRKELDFSSLDLGGVSVTGCHVKRRRDKRSMGDILLSSKGAGIASEGYKESNEADVHTTCHRYSVGWKGSCFND